MYRIAAFDLDGTLADTVPICISAFRDSVSPYAGRELRQSLVQDVFYRYIISPQCSCISLSCMTGFMISIAFCPVQWPV